MTTNHLASVSPSLTIDQETYHLATTPPLDTDNEVQLPSRKLIVCTRTICNHSRSFWLESQSVNSVWSASTSCEFFDSRPFPLPQRQPTHPSNCFFYKAHVLVHIVVLLGPTEARAKISPAASRSSRHTQRPNHLMAQTPMCISAENSTQDSPTRHLPSK